MSAGQGEGAAERFAIAVEHGTPPAGDDVLARELEIVALLRSAGSALAPDPETSARMKQRLMAALTATGAGASAVEESATEVTVPIERVTALPHDDPLDTATELAGTGHSAGVAQRSRSGVGRRASRRARSSRPAARARRDGRPATRGLVRRAVLVSSITLVALVAVLGGGTLASRDALPGDTLYGVKRAAESISLALTFDEDAKARRHLQLAATRLQEIEQLLQHHPNPAAAAADPRVVAALQDFDEATTEGSRLLFDDEEITREPDRVVQQWAAEQVQRLQTLRENAPLPLLAKAEALLSRLLGQPKTTPGVPPCLPGVDDLAEGPEASSAQEPCLPTPLEPGQEPTGTKPPEFPPVGEGRTSSLDPEPTTTRLPGAPTPDTSEPSADHPGSGGSAPASGSGGGSGGTTPTTTTPPGDSGDRPRGLIPLLPIPLPPLLSHLLGA